MVSFWDSLNSCHFKRGQNEKEINFKVTWLKFIKVDKSDSKSDGTPKSFSLPFESYTVDNT
jgi:hypothetical protein